MTALGWVAEAFGEPARVLELRELEPQPVGEGDIRVTVTASGLNFLDVSILRGTHPLRPELPLVPGAELVGVVTEVGAAVGRVEVGDRVAAISPSAHGCFRREAVVPAYAALPMPSEIPDDHAAALLVTYQTAWVSLVRRARVAAGEWVLVHAAAGALGTALVQTARAYGARVVATASTDEKRALCLEQGAEAVFDHRDPRLGDALLDATGGHGLDVVCDSLGGAPFAAALGAAAFEARVLPLGWTAGTEPSVDPLTFVARNLSLVGVSWGAAYPRLAPEVVSDVHEEILGMYARGDIRPVTRAGPSRELPQALQQIGDGLTVGKSVVTWSDVTP